MRAIIVLLSILALVIAVGALFFALSNRATAQNSGIRGDIKIVNDCDGQVASIPANVKILGNLYDDQGQSIGDTDRVGPLGVDPGGNPIKRGTYNLDVSGGSAFGTWEKWKLSITRTNGRPICDRAFMPCPNPTDRCEDQIPKPIEVTYTSTAMTSDINVTCSCVP